MSGDKERFPSMTMPEANAKCGRLLSQRVPDNCPRCDARVILHCDNCKIQVTGCLCTDEDKYGKEEAKRRLQARQAESFKHMNREERRKAMHDIKRKNDESRTGIWTPPH